MANRKFQEVEDAMDGYNFLIFAFGKKERDQLVKFLKTTLWLMRV